MSTHQDVLALAPADRHALYRRSLRVIVVSQIFGGAGLAAGVTVGALLAQDLLGGATSAGIPAALFTLGSAAAAFTIGRISQRRGRRVGLAAGFLVGAIGAACVVVAAVIRSPILFLPALLVYGAGAAASLQARYAGSDLAAEDRRAWAASVALVATTFGAIAGPNSDAYLGAFAGSIGLPPLAGPFILATAALAVAGSVIAVFLRPDPLLIARRYADEASSETPGGAPPQVDLPRGITLGATIIVLPQTAMVAIMTMAPVHMRAHGHGFGEVGFVIGIHVAAMYLPSLVTGPLVDRVGRVPMGVAAAFTLLAAGVTAALAGDSVVWLAIALALLGLGWNFGLISGTALIIDSTAPETRAKTQGAIDVLVAVAGAGGGALSGVIVGLTSYATLGLAGGVLSLLLIPALVRHLRLRVADPA